MAKFKVGDRVRRIGMSAPPHMIKGNVYTVTKCCGNNIYVEGDQGSWDPDRFELVINRPWLKVTPPQPEKRELVETMIFPGITFRPESPSRHTCLVLEIDGCISHKIVTKESLCSLGETLIEISKEMK